MASGRSLSGAAMPSISGSEGRAGHRSLSGVARGRAAAPQGHRAGWGNRRLPRRCSPASLRRITWGVDAATGGSGRSIRTPSMPCSSTPRRDMAVAPRLFTDYTFAVWPGRGTRAHHQGLFGLVGRRRSTRSTAGIRQHTIERFGPVRAVEPVHVFELAFEGLAPSHPASRGDCPAFSAYRPLAHGQDGRGRRTRWSGSRRCCRRRANPPLHPDKRGAGGRSEWTAPLHRPLA